MLAKRIVLIAAGLIYLWHLPSAVNAQTFITTWGSYGTGEGQFGTLLGVAVGGSGNVYVSDQGNGRVQVFTNAGIFLREWPVGTCSEEGCPGPVNIAVDANDNVYVTGRNDWSSTDPLIFKFTSTGTLVAKWGSKGFGPGQFCGNYSNLAVDAAGNVYATDCNRVQVFSPSGAYVREFAANGDGLAVDASGNLYLCDPGNSRVEKFTNGGTYVTMWGNNGTGDGQFGFEGPVRVAVGPEGNVYAVDIGLCRVQAFTGGGTFVAKWGSPGVAIGQFDRPLGIAVDAVGDIYVADKNNSRIQKFGYAPTPVEHVTWGGLKTRYRGEGGTAKPSR